MRIAWYDHGFFHQSAAIPDLPSIEETWGVYGDKGYVHFKLNVVGMELWRIPLLHRLLDDGHELVWLTRRKVDPSPELDDDMVRLAEQYPEYARFVRPHDPCLDEDRFRIWPVRTHLNQHYFTDQQMFIDSGAPTTEMLRYWVREKVLGVPPEADVACIAAMRADEATAFEMSYFMAIYLGRGTPVVVWDQDRQLSGTKAAMTRIGLEWPHPLVTIIGPYEEETSHGKPLTIDYPYVDLFEKDPLPVGERVGGVYVGNDYGRREAMAKLLLSQTRVGIPVSVYGKYDTPDASQWIRNYPDVNWAGRVPTNKVPGTVARGHFTVNIVKKDYMGIGLLTLRTFDSNCYGTLQIGDRRVRRLDRYVPADYLVESTTEAQAVAKKIMAFSDEEYREELERQRSLTRKNDLSAFVSRFYECVDVAMAKGQAGTRTDFTPMRELPPPQQKTPGRMCEGDEGWLPAGHYWHGDPGWSPDWKKNKEKAIRGD